MLVNYTFACRIDFIGRVTARCRPYLFCSSWASSHYFCFSALFTLDFVLFRCDRCFFSPFLRWFRILGRSNERLGYVPASRGIKVLPREQQSLNKSERVWYGRPLIYETLKSLTVLFLYRRFLIFDLWRRIRNKTMRFAVDRITHLRMLARMCAIANDTTPSNGRSGQG